MFFIFIVFGKIGRLKVYGVEKFFVVDVYYLYFFFFGIEESNVFYFSYIVVDFFRIYEDGFINFLYFVVVGVIDNDNIVEFVVGEGFD